MLPERRRKGEGEQEKRDEYITEEGRGRRERNQRTVGEKFKVKERYRGGPAHKQFTFTAMISLSITHSSYAAPAS